MSFSSHTLYKFVELNKYDVSFAEINRLLKSDISDGMQPITNTLDLLDIPNLAIELPKSSFNQLPNCFIAQVSQDEKYNFVLVSKKDDKNVVITYGDNKKGILPNDEFLKHWTGTAIVAEENKNHKKSFFQNIDTSKVGIIIGIVLMLSYLFSVYNDYTILIFAIFSFTGFGLSMLILKEKYGNIGQPSKYCSINNNTSCNAVLNSKYAKLFNTVDLSDVTVVYFAFITLGLFSGALNLLHLSFAVLSIPIIIYSVYFQYFKIQKWCSLCLGIASVLLAQIILLSLNHKSYYNFDNFQIFFYSSLLLLIIVAWFEIKKLLLAYSNQENLIIENMSFRRNYKLFLPYFENQKESDLVRKNHINNKILIGNNNAKLEITVVMSLTCKYCKDLFVVLKKIERKYNVKLNFKLFISKKHNNSLLYNQIFRLIDIYTKDKDKFIEAFEDCYSFSSKVWLNKWKETDRDYSKIIENHYNWCKTNKIVGTPTIFINNKLFPTFYNVKDIVYFIEPLIHNISKKDGVVTV